LTTIRDITPQIARAVVAYRGQHRFQSIADILDVTPPNNQRGTVGASDQSGSQVISENLFMDIADNLTIANDRSLPGLINVNTASLEVLVCLPGVSRELAQSMISQRQSGGYFANLGELLKLPGMSRDLFKQLAPLLTTRSETYRILSEGRITSTGTRQRIQAIVHAGLSSQQILSWREDNL